MQYVRVKHLCKIKKIPSCEKLHVCYIRLSWHSQMKVKSDVRSHSYWKPDNCHTTVHLLLWKTRLIGALSLNGCLTESDWVQWNSLKIHQKIPCRSGSTFVWKLIDEIWLNILQRISRVVLFTSSKSARKFPADITTQDGQTLDRSDKAVCTSKQRPSWAERTVINTHNDLFTLLAVFDS